FSIAVTVRRSSLNTGAGSVLAGTSCPWNCWSTFTVRPSSAVRICTLMCRRDTTADELLGAVRAVGIRGSRFAIGPLIRQQRRQVARVIVMQMSEEDRTHLQVTDVARCQLPYGSIAAVDEIGATVYYNRAR